MGRQGKLKRVVHLTNKCHQENQLHKLRASFSSIIVEPLENCAGDARRTKLHTCRLQQVNQVMNHADAAPVQAVSKSRQGFIFIPINIEIIFEISLNLFKV